jgi:hypothetical protein
MRLRPHFSIAVVLALATVSGAAMAQEWSLDTGGAAVSSAPAKGKKSKPQSAVRPDNASSKPDKSGKVENRQFGELEGWSPGKSPPKKKDKDDDTPRFGGRAPVNMNSNGGMAVGMPF